jgi:hypothetical protein
MRFELVDFGLKGTRFRDSIRAIQPGDSRNNLVLETVVALSDAQSPKCPSDWLRV